jgi:cell division septal protein FtsQ
MVRKVSRKENKTRFLNIVSMAIIVIGVLILLATALTWQLSNVSSLVTKVNLLTLSIGILYLLFGFLLFKVKF